MLAIEAVEMWVSELAEEQHEASLAMLRLEIETQRATLQSKAMAQIEARRNETEKSTCFTQWHWWARTTVLQRRVLCFKTRFG